MRQGDKSLTINVYFRGKTITTQYSRKYKSLHSKVKLWK